VIIEYTPQGGDTEVLDAGRMRASEVQIVERTADMKWTDIRNGLRSGDVTSVRTVAYVLKRRAEPTLRLADFDPFEDEIVVRLDAREVADLAVEMIAAFQDTPEDLAEAFDELREAAFDKDACEAAIKEAQAPKAPVVPAPEPMPMDGSATAA
jgi:hypothetical protein